MIMLKWTRVHIVGLLEEMLIVTRKDVAEYAQVSKSTVSRVLNNNGYVSKESRDRIEEAIQVLGYTPNIMARSLKTKQSRLILYYVPDLQNPFYTEVYTGLEAQAHHLGYVLVVSTRIDLQLIQQRQFDGIVLAKYTDDAKEVIASCDVPAIVINYSSEALGIPYIGVDLESGVEMAMNHLVQMGHREITYLTNVEDPSDVRSVEYHHFVRRNAMLTDRIIIYHDAVNNYFEDGYTGAQQALCSQSIGSALLCYNDAMAMGAMTALREKGIRIPEDVSVVGFDNILQSQYMNPPLTTVEIPRHSLGNTAMERLSHMIEEQDHDDVIIGTQLIIRNSVHQQG